MHGPREVLNELKWAPDRDLDPAEIHYVHRGAPGDTRVVRGSDVVALHASFMEVRAPRANAMIPYHRVFRIDLEGRPVWVRRSRQSGDSAPAACPTAGAHETGDPEGEGERR